MKICILCADCICEVSMLNNMLNLFKKNSIERTDKLADADYLLLITCRATGENIDEYTKYLQQSIDLIQNEKKDLKLIVTGCYTRTFDVEKYLREYLNDSSFKVIEDIDFPVPVINYINNTRKRTTLNTYFKNRTFYTYNTNIRIQFLLNRGCINNCSFCKVHYSEEQLLSTPYQETLEYLTSLIKSGTKELILSGENTTIYGIDEFGYPVLDRLIHDLSQIEGLERIDLFEIVASNMYPELYNEIINNPKVKNVCLQLETSSDRLLKLMNRGYDLKTYDDIIVGFISSGKNISTALMSGFPTEEYVDLDKTIEYLKKRNIICHAVCEYSDYHLIPSSRLPQLNVKEKRKHTSYLNNKVTKNNFRIYRENMITEIPFRLISKEDGYAIFSSNLDIKGVSNKKCYQELELGSIIHEAPEGIIKKSLICNSTSYKL